MASNQYMQFISSNRERTYHDLCIGTEHQEKRGVLYISDLVQTAVFFHYSMKRYINDQGCIFNKC